ncbi:MAG: redoxin domain-containing protein [Armatimonadota bacterium]
MRFATIVGITATTAAFSAQGQQSDVRIIRVNPELRLSTTLGNRAFSQVVGEKLTVVAFIAVNCPIANAYAPDYAKLQNELKKLGGNLILVYSNAGDISEAAEHVRQYGLSECTIVLDQDQVVASAFHASMTPEMYVIKDYQVVYQGRLDDRFLDRTRPKGSAARTNELRNAVDAVLAGRSVKLARTKVFGCAIERALPNGQKGPEYYPSIKAVLDRTCVRCHDASGVAPMSFATYASAKRYANNIASVVAQRQMPPWKAEPSSHSFANLRKVSESDRKALMLWAATGAASGTPTPTVNVPVHAPGITWDIELAAAADYTIPASGPDEYRTFIVPTNFTEDRWIDAVDFKPSNPKVVHRILGFVDGSKRARGHSDKLPALGYNNFGGLLSQPDADLGAWFPGNPVQVMPSGTAWKLPKGSDILVQMHYHPTGKIESDKPSVKLHFAKAQVEHERKLLTMRLDDLFLRAGSVKPFTLTHKVERNIQLYSIMPHMHFAGQSIKVSMTTPDGKETPLLSIRDWDIYWQEAYLFEKPVTVPAGSNITVRAVFDNSTANPKQPSVPPKDVHAGETNRDEKLLVYIGYTEY